MTTFGQRIKKAWKNINEIKQKKEKKMKKHLPMVKAVMKL